MVAFGRVPQKHQMNRASSIQLVLVALTLTFAVAPRPAGAAEPWESVPINPKVEIAYVPPESPELASVYEALKKRRILEELQRFLAPLHLPHHLLLLTKECHAVNAFYSTNRSLTICYELAKELIELAPQTVSEDGFVTHEAAIVGTL